jgi:hypothetical protein
MFPVQKAITLIPFIWLLCLGFILPQTSGEMTEDPEKPRQLTFGGNKYGNLAWLPDGKRIVFTELPSKNTLFIIILFQSLLGKMRDRDAMISVAILCIRG